MEIALEWSRKKRESLGSSFEMTSGSRVKCKGRCKPKKDHLSSIITR